MIIQPTLKTSLLCVSMMLLLSGCEDAVDNVAVKMQAIRSQPALPIEPPPVFTAVPGYSYNSFQLKSPFVPTSVANELQIMAGKRVYPNLNRPLQPLESYALEDLIMKGTMRDGQGKVSALIRTPEGDVVQVQKGNYMGKNYGRVSDITPSQISLIEVVPDGQDGYIERPRNMVLYSSTN